MTVLRNARDERTCRKLELYLCGCSALQDAKAGFKLLVVREQRNITER